MRLLPHATCAHHAAGRQTAPGSRSTASNAAQASSSAFLLVFASICGGVQHKESLNRDIQPFLYCLCLWTISFGHRTIEKGKRKKGKE